MLGSGSEVNLLHMLIELYPPYLDNGPHLGEAPLPWPIAIE